MFLYILGFFFKLNTFYIGNKLNNNPNMWTSMAPQGHKSEARLTKVVSYDEAIRNVTANLVVTLRLS